MVNPVQMILPYFSQVSQAQQQIPQIIQVPQAQQQIPQIIQVPQVQSQMPQIIQVPQVQTSQAISIKDKKQFCIKSSPGLTHDETLAVLKLIIQYVDKDSILVREPNTEILLNKIDDKTIDIIYNLIYSKISGHDENV